MGEIDGIMTLKDTAVHRERIQEYKNKVDRSTLCALCDKCELEIPLKGMAINVKQVGMLIARVWWKDLSRS